MARKETKKANEKLLEKFIKTTKPCPKTLITPQETVGKQ
jgi:hypothetical protein